MIWQNKLFNMLKNENISLFSYVPDAGHKILIENTGPVIKKEIEEKIFERFYRVDPARGSSKPGFGLGLSLARVIARAHGGDLKLNYSEGGVNSFIMSLPEIEKKN